MKLVLIYLVTLFAFSVGGYWLWEKRTLEEKLRWSELQIQTQVQQIESSVTQDFVRLEAFLLQQIQESQKTPMFPFESVQVFQKDAQDWKRVRTYGSDVTLSIPTSFVNEKTKTGFYLSVQRQAPSSAPAASSSAADINYAYITVDRELVLFRLSNDPLTGHLDHFKNENFSLQMVNESRLILAHPIREYRGQLLNAASTASTSPGAFYHSQKIPRTNLSVQAVGSFQSLFRAQRKARWQWIFLVLGLGCLGLSLIYIFVPAGPKQSLADAKTLEPPPEVKPLPSIAAPTADRLKKFGQHLEKPLLSILAQTHQLEFNTETQNNSQASAKTVDTIRAESKKMQNLLEAIQDQPSQDFEAFQKVKPSVLVDRVLTEFAEVFLRQRIHIVREYHYLDTLWLKPRPFSQALEKLIQNSIEALDTKLDKKMKFSIQKLGAEIQIILEDNGDGIGEQQTAHIFDPLFTTKAGPQHVGLGLTQARKWIQEQNGKIQIQSQKNFFTRVLISIPLFETVQSPDVNLFDEKSFQETISILDDDSKSAGVQVREATKRTETAKEIFVSRRSGLDLFPVQFRRPKPAAAKPPENRPDQKRGKYV